MVANHLARWALNLNHLDFQIKYRRIADHQNAVALSRLPVRENKLCDEEESACDVDIVCAISTLTFHKQTPDPAAQQKETARDAVISQLIHFTREGWPQRNNKIDVKKYENLQIS